MNTAISVRLPRELAERLNDVAMETERPRSFIIQKALESYLEDYADLPAGTLNSVFKQAGIKKQE
jgi:RHH-type rel operon transcriptional repressor/antitoxin RelB